MIETVIALMAAHIVADFIVQFNWIITNKRKVWVFLLHCILVLLMTVIALGAFWPVSGSVWLVVALVCSSHIVIDALKTYMPEPNWLDTRPRWNFAVFAFDQLGHVGFIVLAAWLVPNAFELGFWGQTLEGQASTALKLVAVIVGFVLATRVGSFTITIFMARFTLPEYERKTQGGPDQAEDKGLNDGGAWIGHLERSMVYGLVLAGQFEAIGFLIAAKSVLRFQYAKDRSHSEYVIIGTLVSFMWAIGSAWLTLWGIEAL